MKAQTIKAARLTLKLQSIALNINRARIDLEEQGHGESELDLALQLAAETIERFEPVESPVQKTADRIIAIEVRGNVIDIARLLDVTKKIFKGSDEESPNKN